MTTTNDRATSLLERLDVTTPPTQHSCDGPDSRRSSGGLGAVAAPQIDQSSAFRGVRGTSDARSVPRGWGSYEERRMVLLALAAFVVLGLYATGFVLLGHALST